jgi:flagellar assembly protein FliH
MPVVPWRTPDLHAAPVEPAPPAAEDPATAAALAELRRAAVEEGRDAGRQEAVAQHRDEIALRLGQLDAVVAGLQRPFDDLSDAVAGQLVRLAVCVAEQIVRAQWRSDTAAVEAMVREAVAALGEVHLPVRVHLHPADAAALWDLDRIASHKHDWQILENPALSPGGCEVETADSRVDASLESQLAAILDRLQAERRTQVQP